jgi:hypothetical protein
MAKPPAGRWKSCCLRDEFDQYEVCSLCYEGAYQLGVPPKESQLPEAQVFITGTWDNFSTKMHCELGEGGTYYFAFRLGETRVERFRYVLAESDYYSIHPACERAGMQVRVEGPQPWKEGHYWEVDGRDEEMPEGTQVMVRLYQEPTHGTRKVAWEFMKEPGGPQGKQPYAHSYQIIGSWSALKMMDMKSLSSREAFFEYTVVFGVTAQEYFQFARDRDKEQLIYPAYPRAQKTDILVRGPDQHGKDKHFMVFGEQGSKATIQLRVVDGHITVTTKTESGITQWKSVEGKARKKPFVVGSWLEKFDAMKPVDDSLNAFTTEFTMTDRGFEFFQVCFDEDLARAYYPESEGHASGAVIVYGPGAQGEDKNFKVEGLPGTVFKIKLDLKATDQRRIVTWTPLLEEGMPMFPYVNAIYDD